MGSGIAQKIATEGFPVLLVDSDAERAAGGKAKIAALLGEALERKIFTQAQVDEILERVHPTGALEDVAGVDLVIEAIFEDLDVKRGLFERLSGICREDTIFATNTSSFLVADIASAVSHPERMIGLHYFYHPAKNRLVEVIGHAGSGEDALDAAWAFQEKVGKTPITSADAPGFVVNRFFVPWLNEAVRLHEEGISIATIEAAVKDSFGIGMGPFELMNVTGVPITLHATASLGESLGAFYHTAESLGPQVKFGEDWSLAGKADPGAFPMVSDRLWGVVFHVAARLVEEGVSTPEDTDIGARVGLRWPVGPFEKMNEVGLTHSRSVAAAVEAIYDLEAVPLLTAQADLDAPFVLRRVMLEVREGVGHITLNRPDQLNAIDPETVEQLEACLEEAEQDPTVRGIIIGGAGKAFVAGADVKFFVDKISIDAVSDVVDFAANGQRVYRRIETCSKPVVCRLDGLALGGGAELALACHAIVATPKAVMGFPETGIGIYPGLGGTQRLTRRLGKGLARYFLYTGAILSAKELADWKIAWKVVPVDELESALLSALEEAPFQQALGEAPLEETWSHVAGFLESVSLEELRGGAVAEPEALGALKFSRKVGFKAPGSLRWVEILTEIASTGAHEAGLLAETEGLSEIFSSKDALEGLSSVLERRRPAFIGQ